MSSSAKVLAVHQDWYESTTQPGLYYWAEPVNDGQAWHVVSQIGTFPASEAHEDWFIAQSEADKLARDLAQGTNLPSCSSQK